MTTGLRCVAAAAMVATVIAAAPATAVAQSQRFPDVPPDHYAFEAVQWAAEVGVTTGYTDGTFKPARPLIKRHAVVFMERYYDEILQAEESEDFTRGDMMVILKAINDGAIGDTESGTTDTETEPEMSAPPTWLFAENIPDRHQVILREHMESVRAYFSDRFRVEATGFTVLVGEKESIGPVYGDLTDSEIPYVGQSPIGTPWVTRSVTGGAVLTFMYGYDTEDSLRANRESLVHEYFHVLQGQLASGFAQLQTGEVAYSSGSPIWLLEGLATYAEYAYSFTEPGGRDVLDQLRPYTELARQSIIEPDFLGKLASMEDAAGFGDHNPVSSYALSFIASVFLVEEQAKAEGSYVDYWRLLGEQATWQQAFKEAFGILVDDFYEDFNRWTSSPSFPVPTYALLKVQLHLPEGQWSDFAGHVDADIENMTWVSDPPEHLGWSVFWESEDSRQVHVVYDEGTVGKGYLSLWWNHDFRTRCLRGWFKDGGLTASREEATAVEFNGESADIDWNLPAHPSTLQSLNCITN